MFFVISINQGQKDLNYSTAIRCGACGNYSRAQLFLTFSQLLLFFIPTFKWGKRYLLRMTCCGAIYELDREKGKLIENGISVEITQDDLTLIRSGRQTSVMYCTNCGKQLDGTFSFCPYCGEKM